ncbi:MAG TPA: type II toxin-antitoxin system HicA family toxin, partial [Tepidiformaceae bacterium]|nr:type II toxin-antitoxin system HicA family toxin [Tepidiformaceae bacterium]
LRPVSRNDFLRRLRDFGFEGPISGRQHQFMVRGSLRLTVPNPHGAEISVDLLRRILNQAGITADEWLNN